MKILVTGGTTFASRFTAEYFRNKGNEVFVLNRGTKLQSDGVRLIKADRHNLGNTLKNYDFDAIIDVCAYKKSDIADLISALGDIKQYIFVSSSAVYPETNIIPFKESQQCGRNIIWGDYGINKIAAEEYLLLQVPQAYIIRPPYLYGRMNNLYREAFCFDCAEQENRFYLPENTELTLQFFDIEDMCRFIEILLAIKPKTHIFNVGNSETVTAQKWVEMCYKVLGKEPQFEFVDKAINLRNYFPFHNYSYTLDVCEMQKLMKKNQAPFKGLGRILYLV